ncbi:hypothetical protein J437_LFUL001723 [Ladona fulva]|uniref:Uncharacterized protein n=1 Tax=Ladona fulva TaxID=123851 RepID=A0A8K0JZS1_LADFU|nr:hypothetical protein J437_LFUL001723 [Ladona fulva]
MELTAEALVAQVLLDGKQQDPTYIQATDTQMGHICCYLSLFKDSEASETKGVTLIQSWTESQPRQEFSHTVMQNDTYTFSWAFQKLQYDQNYFERDTMDLMDSKYEDDVAKIFSINITNTVDGGAGNCLPCHQDTNERGCIPCPLGQYIDPNSTECVQCPPDTTVSDPMAYGIESCQPCGPGLKSVDGATCSTTCIFNVDDMVYDLRKLARLSDFRYELTECDEEKGRWRVQVPKTPGTCSDQRPGLATRVDNCSHVSHSEISCEPGSYFNLEELACQKCQAGTYSLGGGALFDTWDKLPEGFYTQFESFRSSFSSSGRYANDVNCSRYGWEPRGDFIASLGGPCTATLTYTVHLVKPGNLSYVYQHTDKDVIFDFEAQNEQCQSVGDSKEQRWPSSTKEGEWKKQTIHLKSGQNVLQWKTIGIESHRGKPVLIKSIEISGKYPKIAFEEIFPLFSGIAFASSCTPCRAGTFSQSGSRICTECPKNYYSLKGASSCISCDSKEYSPKGSSKCFKRPLCTKKDFYETRTRCDINNQVV